jgi:PIN domain nuclease of toxin-antitoxin system
VTPVVTDTHCFLWYFLQPERLSAIAMNVFREATRNRVTIFVPSICVVEVIYLVEKSRLPEAAYTVLSESLTDTDTVFQIAPLDMDVTLALKTVDRDQVPDMPDRIIAATALSLGFPLVTRDHKIRGAALKTVW